MEEQVVEAGPTQLTLGQLAEAEAEAEAFPTLKFSALLFQLQSALQ